MLDWSSLMSYFSWFLPSAQRSKIVALCLIELLALILGHSELYRLRYGQFTKARQIAFLVQNLINFRSNSVLAVLAS